MSQPSDGQGRDHPRTTTATIGLAILVVFSLLLAIVLITRPDRGTQAAHNSVFDVPDTEDPHLDRLVAAAARLDTSAYDAGDDDAEMATRTGPTLLFVQDALSGTYTPAGTPGEHWLELQGADAHTLWFENRPGNQMGTMGNQEMLDQFYLPADGGPAEPPNAAIDAWDPTTGQDVVVGLKLLEGTWDPDTSTLRYLVSELESTGPAASGPTRLSSTLPATFDEVGLFIDDGEGLQGPAEGKLVGDIYKAVSYVVRTLSDRRTCSGVIDNVTDDVLTWVTDDSKGTDTWQQNPTRTIRSALDTWPPGTYSSGYRMGYWTTSGAFMRGCWNWVLYKGAHGTVAIGTSDPWSGSNNDTCETTGNYKCQIMLIEDHTQLNGNHLVATYCLYNDRDGEMYCNED